MSSDVVLTLLGTAQDGGVPQPNCYCENCMNALENDMLRRNATSLAIVNKQEKAWHIIDMTPDFKEQIAFLQQKYELQGTLMDNIFLTHAHIGHFPGLIFLGRETMNTNKLPLFAGPKMKQLLETEAPWRQLTDLNNIKIKTINDEHEEKITNLVSVKAVEVPHRNEFSETFSFWISGPENKVLYIPDIDHWDDWELNIDGLCKEADICLLDGTFFSHEEVSHLGRNFREIPHPTMVETMDRLQHLINETTIFFTHFNHSNPVLNANSIEHKQVEERGFHIAKEGMEIQL